MKKYIPVFTFIVFIAGCSTTPNPKDSDVAILPVSQVNWEKLNPARGDKSPRAGTLWGDRTGEVETGFLVKFVDGFSSPPHIHNVSYRAIVIEGLVHNDDPAAAKMWMPTGSYWTQPAGEAHITSAKGKENIALVEIDKGPYLVKPANMEFDNGERPFNIHASNVMWAKQGQASTVPLWKNAKGNVTGTLLKLTSDSNDITLSGSSVRVVVVAGEVTLKSKPNTPLAPGSLITFKESDISLSCLETPECIVYIKSDQTVNVK